MKQIGKYSILMGTALLLLRCGNSETTPNEVTTETVTTEVIPETALAEETVPADEFPIREDTTSIYEVDTTDAWKNPNTNYTHFVPSELDTVRIGPTREYTSVYEYFREDRSHVFVLIDAGEYVTDSDIWIDGDNIIIKGDGKVSLYCEELYHNVMWISGKNVVIDNLHMMHLMPGGIEGQNCSGRVIGLDHAENVTITNCDLNGCGLAGVHDNLGNTDVYVEYNYIHNNSLGAFTDIDGNVWQEEFPNHPVFRFLSNKIENNGFDRVTEEDYYEESDGH